MQTTIKRAATTRGSAEPVKFQQKIGSTVYAVSIHFSRTNNKTIKDKILRMIESEAIKIA